MVSPARQQDGALYTCNIRNDDNVHERIYDQEVIGARRP